MPEESFEKIDYRLRPAKSVERKLLVEALRYLSRIEPIGGWSYVGFGSVYFADFLLFHKALGISDMLSIEKATKARDRFLYNKPYGYVGLLWGNASKHLPGLDWNRRLIIWFDYDLPLTGEVLADLSQIATRARSGSVLLATVDVDPKRLTDDWLDSLRDEIGEDLVPRALKSEHLKGPRGPQLAWRLMDRAIRRAVQTRNLAGDPQSTVTYDQLFNFVYGDGSRMTTVGGMVTDQPDQQLVVQSGLLQLPFRRDGSSPYLIEVPKLTFKEMKALDKSMPIGPKSDALPPGLSEETVNQYAQIHRFFPHFVEADF